MLSRTLAALLVLLALQFVPGVGVGDAQAGCSGNQCDTREEAYAHAMAQIQADPPNCNQYPYQPPLTFGYSFNPQRNWEISARAYCVRVADGVTVGVKSKTVQFPTANGGCPAGTTWNNDTYTCYSADRCLAKPPLGATKVEGVADFGFRVCVAGCSYGPPDDVAIAFVDDDNTQRAYTNGYKPTGDACSAGEPAGEVLPPLEADCAPLDHGQTACQKPNGLVCYKTTRTGRQICWRPGETGEKVDGDILQRRVGGVVVGSPSTIPPYGAMYEPAAAGVEIMAKYGYFRKEGGGKVLDSTSTQTTTTQNFKTDSGVNAGGDKPDQGESTEGGSGSSPGNQGPGGSGEGDSGDGNGNGQPDWTEGEAPGVPGEGDPEPGDAPGPPSIISMGVSMLDETGFLTPSTCPALGVLDFGPFGEFDMDSFPVWCDLVAIMRAIVLIMAAFASLKILMGSKD